MYLINLHAMPRAHAVFPNDVYKVAAIGLSSFFVGPKIIEINNNGPTTHPNTINFYKYKSVKKNRDRKGNRGTSYKQEQRFFLIINDYD